MLDSLTAAANEAANNHALYTAFALFDIVLIIVLARLLGNMAHILLERNELKTKSSCCRSFLPPPDFRPI